MQPALVLVLISFFLALATADGSAGLAIVDSSGYFTYGGSDETFNVAFVNGEAAGTLSIKYDNELPPSPIGIVSSVSGTFYVLISGNLSTNCIANSLLKIIDVNTFHLVYQYVIADGPSFSPFITNVNYTTSTYPSFRAQLITQGGYYCNIDLAGLTVDVVIGSLPGSLGSSAVASGSATIQSGSKPSPQTVTYTSTTYTGSSFSSSGSPVTGVKVGQSGPVLINLYGSITPTGDSYGNTATLYRNSVALASFTTNAASTFSYEITDNPAVNDIYSIVLINTMVGSASCVLNAKLTINQFVSGLA